MNTILSDENVAKTSDVKSEVSLSNLSDLISIKIEAIRAKDEESKSASGRGNLPGGRSKAEEESHCLGSRRWTPAGANLKRPRRASWEGTESEVKDEESRPETYVCDKKYCLEINRAFRISI